MNGLARLLAVSTLAFAANSQAEPPPLNGYPAENNHTRCTADQSKCITRVVVTLSPGRYAHTNSPACSSGTPKVDTVIWDMYKDLYLKPPQFDKSGNVDIAASVGAYVRASGPKVWKVVAPHGAGGDVAAWIDGQLGTEDASTCAATCLTLPSAVEIDTAAHGFVYDDQSGWSECDTHLESCDPPGFSGWKEGPKIVPNGNHQMVCGLFANWSHDRNRTVIMEVQWHKK